MPQLNDKAPLFELKNTNKEAISLSDHIGKPIVLAFFPGAYTGVCDTEMCSLRDNMASFNDLNTTVFGISVDYLGPMEHFQRSTILILIYYQIIIGM